jgi:outer membrane protein assembly factor BamB
MWAIHAQTGATTFQAPIPTASSSPLTPSQPVIQGQTVYVHFGEGGSSAETQALSASTGTVLWSVPSGGYSGVSPAVDSQHLYFYKPNSSHYGVGDGALFTALNKASGTTAFTVTKPTASPREGVSEYRGGTPVLTGNGRALVNRNGGGINSPLDCMDLATQKLAWETADSIFYGSPVVAGNVVYALNATLSRLEARSLEDGHLLWHWSPPTVTDSSLYGNVVATDNIVFVSVSLTAPDHVFAIDTEKRTAVWSYPRSGALSLSASGLLYITEENRVTAINLK